MRRLRPLRPLSGGAVDLTARPCGYGRTHRWTTSDVPVLSAERSAYRGGETTGRAVATASAGSPTTTTETASPRPTRPVRDVRCVVRERGARSRGKDDDGVPRRRLRLDEARSLAPVLLRLLGGGSRDRGGGDDGDGRRAGEAEVAVGDRDEPDSCRERDPTGRDDESRPRVDRERDARHQYACERHDRQSRHEHRLPDP